MPPPSYMQAWDGDSQPGAESPNKSQPKWQKEFKSGKLAFANRRTTHNGQPRLTRHQKLQSTANKHQVFLGGLGQYKRGSQKIFTSLNTFIGQQEEKFGLEINQYKVLRPTKRWQPKEKTRESTCRRVCRCPDISQNDGMKRYCLPQHLKVVRKGTFSTYN